MTAPPGGPPPDGPDRAERPGPGAATDHPAAGDPAERDPAEGDAAGWDAARAVADAVLYEGYLLYPYRRSSGKNKVRWQFGVLAPREWVQARGPVRETVAGSVDDWRQRTECLLEADVGARLRVRVRFLQAQHRSVQREGPGGFVEVDRVDGAAAGGERHLTFDEAVPQEFDVELADLGEREHLELLAVPGGEVSEPLPDAPGCRLVRTRSPLAARVRLSVEDVAVPEDAGTRRLHRVRVEVENAVSDQPVDAPRDEVLRRSLVATHCLLTVRGGSFVSLLEPPDWAADAAAACANLHTFPVLAGAGGGRDVLLSAPIILYDHPGVAPESPGDLFDAGEIDEILSLRTLTLTEEEKREARATDARAREILDRVDAMAPEAFARLHGAVRSLRPAADAVDGERATDPGESAPPPRAVGPVCDPDGDVWAPSSRDAGGGAGHAGARRTQSAQVEGGAPRR